MDGSIPLSRRTVDEKPEELDCLFIDSERSNIDHSAELGVGEYGRVYQADLYVPLAHQTMRVAVKTLKADTSKDLRLAVAERAAQEGYLGASFFFSRNGHAELQNPALVFPTLGYRLAAFNPRLQEHIASAIVSDPNIESKDLPSQLDTLVVSPLQQTPPPTQPIFVVLDALDECQEQGTKELLRLLLSEVPKIPFTFKVLITSRPESHIQSIFHHADNYQGVILHDVESSIIKSDIRLYFQTSLASIPAHLVHPSPKTWVRPEDIELLVERAEKLFVIAAGLRRFIFDETVNDPRSQLNTLLRREEHSGMKLTIDGVYL
ncbi:hypothetical protein FRB98_004020 [Tulasnella sp. 332]|nr:hypothetical protein FRB98_004020 [Tulasnella sp. 332]